MSDSNKDKFFKNYNQGIPQIIKKEFIADIETPISSLIKISENEVQITSQNKIDNKKYVPLSKRQDKPDSALWLIKNHSKLKDSQIAKLIGITKNSVTSIRNKSYWNYNNLNPKDPVAMSLFSQKNLIEAIEKAERRIKREKKEKEKERQEKTT